MLGFTWKSEHWVHCPEALCQVHLELQGSSFQLGLEIDCRPPSGSRVSRKPKGTALDGHKLLWTQVPTKMGLHIAPLPVWNCAIEPKFGSQATKCEWFHHQIPSCSIPVPWNHQHPMKSQTSHWCSWSLSLEALDLPGFRIRSGKPSWPYNVETLK